MDYFASITKLQCSCKYSLILHYLRPFGKFSTLVATNELCLTLYKNMNENLFRSGEGEYERKDAFRDKAETIQGKKLGEFKRDH